jgi:hypothetical protein
MGDQHNLKTQQTTHGLSHEGDEEEYNDDDDDDSVIR